MENLSRNPLFFGVSAEEIEKMMTCFEIKKKNYQERETITLGDRDQDYIGLLIRGSVSVNRINIDGSLDMLEYLEDTGVFGAIFAFSNQTDELMILCEKKCSVLFIEKHHITKRCSNACRHHSIVVENLMRLIAGKVVGLTEKVDILSRRTIRGKLLCYFHIQSGKNASSVFQLPFSFLALSNFLCIDRSAMMRELKKMREEGLVEINGKYVRLL